MSEVAENNQWYKEKGKVLDEFLGSFKTLLSTVAGRGFCKVPGFLQEASLTLEETGKNKLSELNYAIVAEAIKRELTQTGHAYTEAYKAARVAFELEKQTLLTALQQEFSDLDAAQSLTEEELNRLFVELDVRKIILITTKTAIELQLEDLKQELIDIDRLTFANEALLINEKVITANAKMAVIPYIEDLIDAQEKIVFAESANISFAQDLVEEATLVVAKKGELLPYITDKADAQVALSNKKEELLPYITTKAENLTDLSDKKEELIPHIEQKAIDQEDLANKKRELIPKMQSKVTELTELITKKKELIPYITDKADSQVEWTARKNEILPYIEAKAIEVKEVANKEAELNSYIINKGTAQKAFALALAASIPTEQLIMAERVTEADSRATAAAAKEGVINAEIAVNTLREALNTARVSLTTAKVNRQINVLNANSTNIVATAGQHTAMTTTIGNDNSMISSSGLAADSSVATANIAGHENAVETTTGADKAAISAIGSYNAERVTSVADVQAVAKITTKLIHLIGGGN